MSEQTSPEMRRVAAEESDRVVEVRFFAVDSVLCLRFADGYERAVRWADLPFAARLAFAPIAGSVGDGGDSVVLSDAGRDVDLSAESLRAALDDEYREALVSADDRDRRLMGARIRAVREGANLSQLELSRRSGIAQESLSRIEKGRRDPRLGTLRRLAQGMGLSLDQLLERLGAE